MEKDGEGAGKLTARVLHGDCVKLMRELPANSVDAIVTDPPYGIGLLGKAWDGAAIAAAAVAGKDHTKTTGRSASVHAGRYNTTLKGNRDFQRWTEAWAAEAFRVLKPGGHLLAFGSPRTYHRLTAGIEDAGFEVRDAIHWLYASGFPKSMDISKAIDRQRDDTPDVYRVTAWVKARRDAIGISNRDIDSAFGFAGMAGHWTSQKSQPTVPTLEQIPKLLEVLKTKPEEVPDDVRRLLFELNGRKGQPGEAWLRREVTGTHEETAAVSEWRHANGEGKAPTPKERRDKPASDEAKKWQGWGTSLAPAHEPIVVARKPFPGTTVRNVLAHDVGALNIDGTRVPGELNRWPSNVVLDSAAVEELERQKPGGGKFFPVKDFGPDDFPPFIYQAKPSRKERDEGLEEDGRANVHPTVKPVALMRHLIRLVTPAGGTVLDPFAGSGTTLVAGILEGMSVVGCEMTDEYMPIIRGRVAHAEKQAGQMRLLP